MTPDDVVASLGDLRLRAPRTLEELSGERVVASYDLSEWSVAVVVGRRRAAAAACSAIAGALLGASAVGYLSWWVSCPSAALSSLLAVVFLVKKVWLVLERGDEQAVHHVWDGGEGDEARVRFLAHVLGAAKPSNERS